MILLVVFVVCLVVGQAMVVGTSLLIERLISSHASLLAFIPLYFGMFWVAWRFAVRITEPQASASKSVPARNEDVRSPQLAERKATR